MFAARAAARASPVDVTKQERQDQGRCASDEQRVDGHAWSGQRSEATSSDEDESGLADARTERQGDSEWVDAHLARVQDRHENDQEQADGRQRKRRYPEAVELFAIQRPAAIARSPVRFRSRLGQPRSWHKNPGTWRY